jgi:hypothetical protein
MKGVQVDLGHLETRYLVSLANSGLVAEGAFNICRLREWIDIDNSARAKIYTVDGR